MQPPISAYRGDGTYVFVCYAHEDADPVYREIAWLNDYGVNVWYDEGISPGHEWSEELASAIQGCMKVLYFVTPNSVTSEHCRRELNFAQEEGREVVAIHLQPTEVPAGLRLRLNNRQAILKHQLSDEEFHKRLIRMTRAGAVPLSMPVAQSNASSSKRGLGLALIAAVLSIVAVAVWWLSAFDDTSSDEATIPAMGPARDGSVELLHNSVAVLPFDNLSLDPENAYFAAGIHEEVLNQLVKIKDLSVIARTTMLQYEDTDKTVPEIAAELNVNAVMEGSVRYAGDRVRIVAQLIDAQSGSHLWSEAYEENLQDIFGVQLAIATRIAGTLEAQFSSAERTRVSMRATDDPQAYAHYLRAVSQWGNYAPTGPMHEAVDAAIALDPRFAAALAFKALLHTMETIAGGVFVGPDFDAEDQRRFASLAEQQARLALALDEEQAQAHWALGWVQVVNGEWRASERSFDRALELNPNDYIVLNGAAWSTLARGDVDGGVQLMERSAALNPGDFGNQMNFAGFLNTSERWEDAKRQANLVISLAPDAPAGYVLLAETLSILGETAGARTNAALAEARLPGRASIEIAHAYARIGDEANARRIFDLVTVAAGSKLNPWARFWMHVAVADYEVALDYLESAIDEGYPWGAARDLHYFAGHPRFDPVRSHPAFVELVRRAAMPLERRL